MTTFDIRLFGAIEIHRNSELLTDFRSQKASQPAPLAGEPKQRANCPAWARWHG